ncbi:MAG: UpxY family transcription antiterminator [Bacteroidales bacterium]|nr:UpxY family transcription antiterminator [Bacteroidales bacterium]
MINRNEDKKWFAIYVRSRFEKKVFQSLDDIGIESFLPLISRIKQWSDRKKKVEEPLFRSYLFVRILPKDETTKHKIEHVSGVVKFVSIGETPVPVPDNQIAAIKTYIADNTLHEVNCEDYKEGELVLIKSGNMKDLIGRFVNMNGKHRVIINIESVGQSLPIDVPLSNIEVYRKGT